MKIIVVETHNTDRPATSWKRGAVDVPMDGERLIQRNGRMNVNEFIIHSTEIDAGDPDRVNFDLSEPVEKWFAEDLYPILGNDKFVSVSWFDIDR
jgi:hypothetical protein